MTTRSFVRVGTWMVVAATVFCAGSAVAAGPDHPIITEIYTDPIGLADGPVTRDVASLHQEFIEIYIPPLADLDAALNADALRMTYYEVEGDLSSSGTDKVNYRFDLPTFDLNPGNGMTGEPRPASGVVVLGWVDYFGNPPTDLAGTPSTRTGLVNGGIAAPPADYLFIPINGNQFTGTINFVSVVDESFIDPAEATGGIVQNGSGAHLLVNRDSAGYVKLCDDAHFADCIAGDHPHLESNVLGLTTAALLDGVAMNDDSKFKVIRQPYSPGDGVDLETTLPDGGPFSLLIPQVPESSGVQPVPGTANGYARVWVDVAKTTENASALDDDPVLDAQNAYRHIRNDGPFFATPGRASLTTSAPELAVALAPEQTFDVLSMTVGHPGVVSANLGGSFGIDMVAATGASSNGTIATFSSDAADIGVLGQAFGFPRIAVTPTPGAIHTATATVPVTVTATNTNVGDPAVTNPVQMTTMTARVLNPTTGIDELGFPVQATVFAAVQGIPAQVGVTNEFLTTSLGAFAAANLGFAVQDGRAHGAILADPSTDLNAGFFVQTALIEDFPDPALPLTFINAAAPPGAGMLDLVQTVVQSAEQATGSGAYDATINPTVTGLRALRLNHPDILTFGGTFTPTEPLHFVEPTGRVGNQRSGLSFATTTRTFELAIVDANVRNNNSLETGATDDLGIIVEVLDVEVGSPIVTGEYVFLSFTGGVQGMDIDSLDVPGGPNVANIIFLDLDNLHDVLGIRSIRQIFAIDSNGTGELDPIEVYALNPIFIPECITNAHCDDANACTTDTCNLAQACVHTALADGSVCGDGLFCNGTDTCLAGACVTSAVPCPGACEQCDEAVDVCNHCRFDLDNDPTGVIGTGDFGLFSGCFGLTLLPADPGFAACVGMNFDGLEDGVTGEITIGTGDFGVFSGCFGQSCGACATCFP